MFLFAQQFGQPRGAMANTPPDWGPFLMIMGFVICISLVIGLIIYYFFAKNLSDLMKQVRPRNRKAEPGQAYYFMIPLFNIIWIFLYTPKVAQSLDREFEDRGKRQDGDFGKTIGMWWGICTALGLVPFVNYIAGIPALVFFVLYWVKTYGWRKELERGGRSRDEDDDDRPRRNRDDDDDR